VSQGDSIKRSHHDDGYWTSLGQWHQQLYDAGFFALAWPARYGGRELPPVYEVIVDEELARAGAPPKPSLGYLIQGISRHGSEAVKERFLPGLIDGRDRWCQGFSEPDAGSDLASLATRAERVDDGWLLSGQKVWTSYATFARWGICLARTDPDAPKHRGISYLVVDMDAPGIEIRPLVQLTGEAEFNEVFLDEVFVPDDRLVGGLNTGWAVANTTLAHERGTNFPFKEQVVHEVHLDELYRLAQHEGALDDEEIGDELAQAFVELRVLRLHNWRTLSRLGRGEEPGAESSWVKLAWTDMTQHLSDAALDVLGAAAPLARGAIDNPAGGAWQRQWLWSKAASIAGGTTEIQKTIIGERLLGLPRS
jgi:alkylation response protein AidB-like acyl-CoA dehydrogenase